MHHHLLPSLFVLLLLATAAPPSLSHPTVSSSSSSISFWCNQTPHPQPCLYYLSHSHHPKHLSDFYRLSLRLTLRLAVRARRHVHRLRHHCHTRSQNPAWLDCFRLYSDTVHQLRRTLHPCHQLDSQTWLSAALTNLQTCRSGFSDLRQPHRVIDLLSRYNLSELISNCLAINRGHPLNHPSSSSEALTSWSSVPERRLLQVRKRVDVVVAKDGSGNFSSIMAAIDAAATARRRGSKGRFVIYVKTGVYYENVQIASGLNNVTLVGDGKGMTVITGSRSVAGGYTTFSSATFNVFGDGFIAEGITFRNTYGPGSQAVAMLSGSDRSVFYQCSFEGYQDTLFVYSQRQFFRNCEIYGTIDFIFGNAAVVLQNCTIYVRKPRHGEANAITAQGRLDPNQNTGIVIHSSAIRATSDLWLSRKTVKSYLGRPWMKYSRTIFLENYLQSIIDPAGWLQFSGNNNLDTLYYVEYKNTGAGSRLSKRVKWPGFHAFVRPSQVMQFTVGNFIAGGGWIPDAGVPFNPKL